MPHNGSPEKPRRPKERMKTARVERPLSRAREVPNRRLITKTRLLVFLVLTGLAVSIYEARDTTTPESGDQAASLKTPNKPAVRPEVAKITRIESMRQYLDAAAAPLPKIEIRPFETSDLDKAIETGLMPIEQAIENALKLDPARETELQRIIFEQFPPPEGDSYQIKMGTNEKHSQAVLEIGRFLGSLKINITKTPIISMPDQPMSKYHYSLILKRIINRRLLPRGYALTHTATQAAVGRIILTHAGVIGNGTTEQIILGGRFVDDSLNYKGGARFDPDANFMIADEKECSLEHILPALRQRAQRVPWLAELEGQITAAHLDYCHFALVHEAAHADTHKRYQQDAEPEKSVPITELFTEEELAFFKSGHDTQLPVTHSTYHQLDEMAAHGLTLMRLADKGRTEAIFDLYIVLLEYMRSPHYRLAHFVLRPLLFAENEGGQGDHATPPDAVEKLKELQLTVEELKTIGHLMFTLGRKGIIKITQLEKKSTLPR